MAWLHKVSNFQRRNTYIIVIKTMADATDDRIRELEIMIRLIDIEIILARRHQYDHTPALYRRRGRKTVRGRVRPCIPVLDRVWPYLTMYDSYLNRIGRIAIVWNRVCTRVNSTVIVWHSGVNPGVGCRTWERSRTIPYDLYTILTRLSSLVEWTSCTVAYTVSYGLTRSLTVLYDRLYDHTRTWHPCQFFKSFKNHARLSRIHSNGPSVTRIRPRLVRLYVRFTRVANRISRVFCVRQALRPFLPTLG